MKSLEPVMMNRDLRFNAMVERSRRVILRRAIIAFICLLCSATGFVQQLPIPSSNVQASFYGVSREVSQQSTTFGVSSNADFGDNKKPSALISANNTASIPLLTRTTWIAITTTDKNIKIRKNHLKSLLLWIVRKVRPWRRSVNVQHTDGDQQRRQHVEDNPMYNQTTIKKAHLNFTYEYDTIELFDFRGNRSVSSTSNSLNTTGILLIHPIGVGIGKWYYQRLFTSLCRQLSGEGGNRQIRTAESSSFPNRRLVVVVPDLLGSGSACNATITTDEVSKGQYKGVYPLFNISDWTDQVMDLMAKVGDDVAIDQWCVVANGGCSPIALQAAERSVEATISNSTPKVSNVVLSSVPRLPFFLPATNRSDPKKVQQAYRTLCGITGTLFWWYACRNRGSFIRTFSEKNLVADPANLGDEWQSNCYVTATKNSGRSKYSTFAFLAGTLQDGCTRSLEVLRDSSVHIDVIKGADVRRNRARSWFWQKTRSNTTRKEERTRSSRETDATKPDNETIRQYLKKNGNGGNEVLIKGRISLAHEDPDGYARAILQFLS